VRDYDYALAFASSAARIFGKSESYHIAYRQGRHRVEVNSLSLHDLISKGIETFCDVVYEYPASFIRGFFDGDGDVTTSLSKGRLHVCLRVTNSNKELLLFISDLLLRFFGITSYFRQIRKGPRIDCVEGRKVRFKKATYQLKIDRLEQLALFAKRIGFKIERKQEKLTDATRLIKRYSSWGATEHWLELYEKKNGFWKRRASGPQ
jgi:intein-encoded DNA endonuclease-like protein